MPNKSVFLLTDFVTRPRTSQLALRFLRATCRPGFRYHKGLPRQNLARTIDLNVRFHFQTQFLNVRSIPILLGERNAEWTRPVSNLAHLLEFFLRRIGEPLHRSKMFCQQFRSSFTHMANADAK